MNYIFINPVTQNMYNKKELSDFLNEHNYTQVYCKRDWLSYVRNEYKKTAAENPGKTVFDMRCPKAADFAKQTNSVNSGIFPSIHPILIHCAKELSDEYGESDFVIITTPCKSLADYGNSLQIKNTYFISWNDFAKETGCSLNKTHLEASPIPPGFFSDMKTISLTGEDDIKNFFTSEERQNAEIIEMLFCKDGCNNGDGVL